MRPGRRVRWTLVAIMMVLPSSAWKRRPAAETKPRVTIHLPPLQLLERPASENATPRQATAEPGLSPAPLAR